MSSTVKVTDMGWGADLYSYTSLTEPLLTSELKRLSSAQSHSDTDFLSFQPCRLKDAANQDRYAIHDWPLHDGVWSFRAIFDGHAGHATVDHVVQTLPDQIRTRLQDTPSRDPDHISNLLIDSVIAFDDAIAKDFLRLVPDPETIQRMSDDELDTLVKEIESSPEKNAAVRRCMHGSTALISLLDPSRRNLWVVSLGDCQAALGRRDNSGKWSASLLSAFHNGRHWPEVERILNEHPEEDECVHHGRVLGAIAVTRALGDFEFKLPAVFTDRILSRTNPGFKFSATTLPEVLARTLTPPYLSNRPEVQYVSLADRDQFKDICLVMCSDGLLDLYLDSSQSLTLEQLPSVWLEALDSRDTSLDPTNNLSLALLRDAIGGNDTERVSKNMSLNVNFRRATQVFLPDVPVYPLTILTGDHYKSDHHRYNMKRRVAGLPPVSLAVFNQKVLDRKEETAIMSSPRGSVCEACNKTYTTENSYRSHLQSKKHKENEVRAASKSKSPPPQTEPESEPTSPPKPDQDHTALNAIEKKLASLAVNEEATEEEINRTIDEKIAAARSRLSPTHCLFCPEQSSSLEDNLTHMSTAHSFFVPDADYLIDITGLITYLGEKIAVGNVCIYCNGKGREFRTLGAVRKHMVDKSHCKIAYDTENERLEVSDYYDFTASYPDAHLRKKKQQALKESDEEWEDMDEDEDASDDEADEVVDEEASESESESEDDDEVPENQITYGDSNYELVLPSGARIGHRSMKRYYAQSFPGAPRGGKPEDPNSGAALVRRLLADKNSALVPRKGGFGAYGAGTDVVKARNRGEAREAGRHVREFRDQRRREDFKTKVGYIHNHQKHYRDPLLQ
ncbi:hypothetical protein NP233_g11624 [Leucocoprinus birnbaumii]|uniref:PPM-type phosphatase domain-containing protein n=1 Tax=Leucocoprinus birnbaumii TaxID=56174 RepID=A0AAD5VH44_9AGAR|nr:hypothetical protein NP233_g11624 [Leucocoprinus birnbaumii]